MLSIYSVGKLDSPGEHRARPLRKIDGAKFRESAPLRNSDILVNTVNNTDFSQESTLSNSDTDTDDRIVSHNDSKFIYLNVKFHTVHVAALIDSGSSVNLMSTSLYNSIPQSCKTPIDTCNGDNIKLANDQTVQIKGTATVRMSYKGDKHYILVYILNQTSHPFILGTSYLINNKITIDFGNLNVLQKCANVRCRKRVTVDPHSEIIIWGKLPRNIQYGLQGLCESSSKILSKGLICSKAVANVSENRTVPVKILNLGNDCITIPKEKILPNLVNKLLTLTSV